MIPFEVEFSSGVPVYEQIVLAVKKALARRRLRPGDRFPSVRAISRELKVNPNTVQKALGELTRLGLLEIHPGRGAYVSRTARPSDADVARLLHPLAGRLVIEASSLGLSKTQLQETINEIWKEMRDEQPVEH